MVRVEGTLWGMGTYSHLIRCKFCDSAVIWVPKKKVLKSAEKLRFMTCTGAQIQKLRGEHKVKVHAVNEKKIDEAFESVLEGIQIAEKIANEFAAILRVKFDSFGKNQAIKVNRVKDKLNELGKRDVIHCMTTIMLK